MATMTREQWDAKVEAASAALDSARRRIRSLQDKVRAARATRDAAVLAFSTEFPIISELENQRSYIASEQARKARNVSAGRRPTDDGDYTAPAFQSVIDATAAGMSGGNKRAGGGNAFRQGAFTTRGGRVKLPSDL